MGLMQQLESKRREIGMNTTQFAQYLGIQRDHYYKMLNGERPIGEKLRAGVARRFPDLTDSLIASYRTETEAVA